VDIPTLIALDDELQTQRLAIGLRHQALIYDALMFAHKRLLQKQLPKLDMEFASKLLVLAFFRVPQYQDELILKMSVDMADGQLDEWMAVG